MTGFSKELRVNKNHQKREKEQFGGYYGFSGRTSGMDAYVEKKLREEGLKGNGISEWLSSTSARHMTDNLSKNNFKDHINLCVRGAYLDVVVWSHPDHKGNLGSSGEIRKRLQEIFVK